MPCLKLPPPRPAQSHALRITWTSLGRRKEGQFLGAHGGAPPRAVAVERKWILASLPCPQPCRCRVVQSAFSQRLHAGFLEARRNIIGNVLIIFPEMCLFSRGICSSAVLTDFRLRLSGRLPRPAPPAARGAIDTPPSRPPPHPAGPCRPCRPCRGRTLHNTWVFVHLSGKGVDPEQRRADGRAGASSPRRHARTPSPRDRWRWSASRASPSSQFGGLSLLI